MYSLNLFHVDEFICVRFYYTLLIFNSIFNDSTSLLCCLLFLQIQLLLLSVVQILSFILVGSESESTGWK